LNIHSKCRAVRLQRRTYNPSDFAVIDWNFVPLSTVLLLVVMAVTKGKISTQMAAEAAGHVKDNYLLDLLGA
jgi:hypothetical protein